MTVPGPSSILSVYAPTLCSAAEANDAFNKELETRSNQTPAKEHLFDFNARVGADHDSWPRCIGRLGISKQNENGQRLLELSSYRDICLTNTFFPNKPHHKVSWRYSRSRNLHQLNFTRRSLLNHVLVTRTFISADCDTDYSLVVCKVRLFPRRVHCSKQKAHSRINTSRTALPELRERFARAVNDALDNSPSDCVCTRWNHIRNTVFQSALDTIGRRERKSSYWFEAVAMELEPAIADTHAALLAHKKEP